MVNYTYNVQNLKKVVIIYGCNILGEATICNYYYSNYNFVLSLRLYKT